jgi:hypothetical protein
MNFNLPYFVNPTTTNICTGHRWLAVCARPNVGRRTGFIAACIVSIRLIIRIIIIVVPFVRGSGERSVGPARRARTRVARRRQARLFHLICILTLTCIILFITIFILIFIRIHRSIIASLASSSSGGGRHHRVRVRHRSDDA